MNTGQRYAVGIDLGTTFSSLGFVDESGRPDTLRFPDEGSVMGSTSYSIASAIYFEDQHNVIVGNRALEYAMLDPLRLARAFKRQMGNPAYCHQFDSETPELFEIDGRQFRPEELSSMILRRLKDAAEQKLGPVENVVISVPHAFDEPRRRATQDAGYLAGFRQVELVHEPVAAALAYGHKLYEAQQSQGIFNDKELAFIYDDQVFLVYDLGGGTFDATLMRLDRQGKFEVIATAGDGKLGGEDWDKILYDLSKVEMEKAGVRFDNDPRRRQELWMNVLEAKKTLSENPRAEIPYRAPSYKQELVVILKLGDFKRESRSLLDRTTEIISEMLAKKKKRWNFVDRIVIVGGASRMPMVREALEEQIQRDMDMSLSPDTAIAKGAALYAASKFGLGDQRHKMVVETVNSHALGLWVKDATGQSVNDILIEANTKTGTSARKRYRLKRWNPDKRLCFGLVVLEGEHPEPTSCSKLGEIKIDGVPHDLQDGAKLEVLFAFDDGGLLNVKGLLHIPGAQQPLELQTQIHVTGRMTKEELEEAKDQLRGVEFQ